MTEEEKKEFEEFLKWKKQKATKQETVSEDAREPKATENKYSKTMKSASPTPKVIKTAKNRKRNRPIYPLIMICVCILYGIILYSFERCKNSWKIKGKSDTDVVKNDVKSTNVLTPVKEPVKVTWDITTETDAMTDSKNIWAKITSDDYICQDFPYEGLTYAYITARYMKKYGYDVLIQISKGQINGRDYNGTNYITARFDGSTPKRYYFDESADGSPETVFIRQHSDFIKKCKQAKNIKIDIPIYQSGRPVFSFHVDEPLVWPK